MHVGVAYADRFKQRWFEFEVPRECTVREAIERSGLLDEFPDLDLEHRSVGIFGRLTTLDAALRDGDRVEIYRPITADPETVERRDVEP